jgi:hypothetical protein
VPHFGDPLLERIEPFQRLTLGSGPEDQRFDLLELLL